jgi:hypothetical protein
MTTESFDKYSNNAASLSGLTWNKPTSTNRERPPAMNPKAILTEAAALIDDRGVNYGGIEQNFERAASLATLKLNRNISAYDVAIVMESVKDARRAIAPEHYDSHLDGINYRAFALLLSGAQKNVPTTPELAAMLNKMGAERE